MVAAAVVGEVLLRGGEVGSVVPTKVPGNLERNEGGPDFSCCSPGAARTPLGRDSLGDLHGSLGAGSMREAKRGDSEVMWLAPAHPHLQPRTGNWRPTAPAQLFL